MSKIKNIIKIIIIVLITALITYFLKPDPAPQIITYKINTRLKARKLTIIKPQNSDPIKYIFEDLDYSQNTEIIKENKRPNLLGLDNKSVYYLKLLDIKYIKTPFYIGLRYNYVDRQPDLILFYNY